MISKISNGVKKYLLLASIVAVVVVLAGCGPTPPPADQKPVEYKLSESIWKSTDGAKTWEVKNITLQKPNVTDLDVLRIVVNPLDSKMIYVGLRNGGMIKSSDGGDHWEFTNFISQKVYGLELDPTDGKTLYASGVWQNRGKIFKSEDAGENWKEIYTTAAEGPLVVSMALDPKNTQALYAATSDNQLLKSSDGGNSWKNIYRSNSPIVQMAIDKSNDNLVYFLSLGGNIYRSSNGGNSVEDISSKATIRNNFSFSGGGYRVLAVDPNTSNSLYLAGNSGIIRSNNAGETWEKVTALDNPESYPVTALAINQTNPQEIAYGASQAAYKSQDGGNNWATFQFSVSKYINIMTYDPTNPNIVYAGFRK